MTGGDSFGNQFGKRSPSLNQRRRGDAPRIPGAGASKYLESRNVGSQKEPAPLPLDEITRLE